MTVSRHAQRVPALQYFVASAALISEYINRILWKKCLLLRIKIARKALPLSAFFESCALS